MDPMYSGPSSVADLVLMKAVNESPSFSGQVLADAPFVVLRMKWGDACECTQVPELFTDVTGERLGSCPFVHRYLYGSA